MLRAELSWKRIQNTTMADGQIVVMQEDRVHEREFFERLEFQDMIERLSATLQRYDKMPVFFRRTERPNLVPLRLEEATVELLRTDFRSALEALTWNPPPPSPPKATRPATPRDVGINSFVDAFGDRLYLRHRKNGMVECPGCGLWSHVEEDTTFRCVKRCQLLLTGKVLLTMEATTPTRQNGWFEILTEDLLRTKGFGYRYFLPLPWNTGGPKISREDLLRQFEEWNQIKEKVSC